VPSVAAIGPLRRTLLPGLCGVSARPHVALTFDDGPDPASTPKFLDALAAEGVRATFFLLGTQLAAAPDLARRIVQDGHEVAVHSWTHRPHLLQPPHAIVSELRRTRDLVVEVTGQRPRFWRPPNGIPTGTSLLAARTLGMRTVLWTGDGRDWRASATGASIAARLDPHLRRGGVVLLHDSDVTSAPDSWRAALDAVPQIVATCRLRGLSVGSLASHWSD